MRCSEFRNLISEFLDDELDYLLREEFLIHLLNCEPCKDEFMIFLKENRLLRRFLENITPPSTMWDSFLNMLNEKGGIKI